MVYLLGSSPCIRGGFSTKSRMEATKGTIPAHMGQIYGEVPEFRVPETHPRVYGVDPGSLIVDLRLHDSSPCVREEYRFDYSLDYSLVHPRVYGADTKLPKKISEIAEHPLPPQNPMIESVCIIFLKCIFADNTFWLFSMFFCKKRDAGGTSFSVCFLVMTFFFVCAQSVSKRLHMTVRFYTFPAVEDSYI